MYHSAIPKCCGCLNLRDGCCVAFCKIVTEVQENLSHTLDSVKLASFTGARRGLAGKEEQRSLTHSFYLQYDTTYMKVSSRSIA